MENKTFLGSNIGSGWLSPIRQMGVPTWLRNSAVVHATTFGGAWAQSIFGIFIAYEMYSVFGSLFLSFLALAFLFYIPQHNPGTRWANRIISISLLVVLFIFAHLNYPALGLGIEAGLKLPSLLFYAVFLISVGVAFRGSIQTKQVFGTAIIIIAFITYTFGVGTQNVGAALFGEWWPQIYGIGSQVFTPAIDAAGQFFETIGKGFSIITNPVGYANQIIQGQYQKDSQTGVAGAFGVEIKRVTVSSIYPNQPYQIIVGVENKGAFDAENVYATLSSPRTSEVSSGGEYIDITDLGFDPAAATKAIPDINASDGVLLKTEVDEVVFEPERTGVRCESINKYQLREKAIPLQLDLVYDYKIESSLDVQVISIPEWDRLIKSGKTVIQKKLPATLSNAPVKLNIDSPDQPVKETRLIPIGLTIAPAGKDGKIKSINGVELSVPKEVMPLDQKDISCTRKFKADFTNSKLIFDVASAQDVNVIYCNFKLQKQLVDKPTTTLLFTARANYTYAVSKTETAIVQKGGGCCSSTECLSGQSCTWKADDLDSGRCEKGSEPTSTVTGSASEVEYDSVYCSDLKSSRRLSCDIGQGGCLKNPNECRSVSYPINASSPAILSPLECKQITDVSWNGLWLCCPRDATDNQCKAAYIEFLRQQKLGAGYDFTKIIDEMLDA